MMTEQQAMDSFLNGAPHAVAGASRDRSKYGNRVLRVFQQNNLAVYPINPHASEIEGLPAYRSLDDLPEAVYGCAIITPPDVTEEIVEDAIRLGVRHLWMQPGAESAAAIEAAEAAGISVVSGGPCLLVVLGYRGD